MRTKDLERLDSCLKRIRALEKKIAGLRRLPFVVPITTLAPEPYEILQEIKAVVEPADDEFIATFFDANISAGGSNQAEAVANLKDLLISRLEYLGEQPAEKLGPGPTKQIAVLREFIRRR